MIYCKDLFFGYSNKMLFNGLSANFEKGHIYGLLGKNGAGKTTLLKCITGLLHFKKGNIEILGTNPMKRKPEVLSEIFFFPESFYLPAFTGEKYYRLYKDFYPRFDESYFLSLCSDFEVPLNQNLRTLSFGQKKKFYLAFGLSTFAKIILLDEPTNGLDIPSKVIVRKKLAESLGEEQLVIISTHQVRDLSQLFDSIIVLHDGKIIFNNSLEFMNQNFDIVNESELTKKYPEIESDCIIYSEDTPLGKVFLVKKANESEKNLDIEFFFNAVISNPAKFQN